MSNQITLPTHPLLRMSEFMPFLPIGKSTVWVWIKDGKFPQPIKLSPTVTVWRNSDIQEWLDDPTKWVGEVTPANYKKENPKENLHEC
ncbi:MAG: AlpA family phage regulatory protein [Moraxella sp.]|nr:AlpA family phage regulatory protein [Moraxella sp.]